MPTEKPRVTITVTEEQLKEIEEFRYSNKMKNQTQAILSLVNAGLKELNEKGLAEIKKASESAETDTKTVRENTINAFKDVLGRAGLLNENQDLSDSDLEFIKAMFLAMKAHFKQSEKDRD